LIHTFCTNYRPKSSSARHENMDYSQSVFYDKGFLNVKIVYAAYASFTFLQG